MKKTISLKTVLAFSAILGVSLVLPGEAKGGSKPSSCTDIPLQVTLAPISDTSTGGIYGDAGAAVPTTYTDGVGGVYAKFQVCNGSNDFILNLSQSTRTYTINFDDQLVAGDPGATTFTGPVKSSFMNINEVAKLSLYSNGQLNTCFAGDLGSSKGVSYSYHFTNTGVWQTNGGTPNCPDGSIQQTTDKYTDTSFIQVTVGANCSSWTITPLPLTTTATGSIAPSAQGQYVTGFVEQTSKSPLSGGNYNMPFTITLTRTDGGGCASLP